MPETMIDADKVLSKAALALLWCVKILLRHLMRESMSMLYSYQVLVACGKSAVNVTKQDILHSENPILRYTENFRM